MARAKEQDSEFMDLSGMEQGVSSLSWREFFGSVQDVLRKMRWGIEDALSAPEKEQLLLGKNDFTTPAPAGWAFGNTQTPGRRQGMRNIFIILATAPVVFLMVVMTSLAVFGQPQPTDRDVSAHAATLVLPAAAEQTISTRIDQRAGGALGATLTSANANNTALVRESGQLVLPSGVEVKDMTLDGDRLAIRVVGKDGAAIVIYDLQAGRIVQTVELASAGL